MRSSRLRVVEIPWHIQNGRRNPDPEVLLPYPAEVFFQQGRLNSVLSSNRSHFHCSKGSIPQCLESAYRFLKSRFQLKRKKVPLMTAKKWGHSLGNSTNACSV
ncbi:uncharacterized protein FAM241A isoform X3 [Carcharodon carcharias]|uniref:uncharacterized protein FAM241A isoform X3 n=1 Tax=Carcharodon carcharias TaxID=13397 RepID=UPI001B7DA202|nr:uncharacterized protein FAM241A isoform X3 [Carcharodon carcharias]